MVSFPFVNIPHFRQRFAIVIPVYNHEERVRDVVEAAVRTGLPVIVVDDGSTDASSSRVMEIPGIRILRHPVNRGKGAALLTGFAEAAGIADWAVTVDADGQHDPAEITGVIKAIPSGLRPIVIGMRRGMNGVDVPWTSRFGRKFSNFWVWSSGGPLLSDSQSGFRVYPLPEVLELAVQSRRFQFEVEVLARATWKGIPILEAPVSVSYTPGVKRISHFRPFVDFMRNSSTFSRLILQRMFVSAATRRRRSGKQPPSLISSDE